MIPQALIFDFGGVVVHWDPRRVYRRFLDTDAAIDAFFEEVGFHAWNRSQDRGPLSWSAAVSDLSARFPHRADLIRAFDELWEDSIGGPIEGTVRILEQLHASGYRLFGLTNWSAEKFYLTERRYDLFRLFDDIIVSGEVGLMKPEREIFEWTLRRIRRRADECLFIDDHQANVVAATSLGIRTIHFQSPSQLQGELQKMSILREGCT